MIKYFLTAGSKKIDCGLSMPVYNEAIHAWQHDYGKVSDWDGTKYKVESLIDDSAGSGSDAPYVSPSNIVGAIAFQLLFTIDERVVLRRAIDSDPVLQDFFRMLDDPRLAEVDLSLNSTKEAVDYCFAKLVGINIMTSDQATVRMAEVLSGQPR